MARLVESMDILLASFYEKAPAPLLKKEVIDKLNNEFPDAATDNTGVTDFLIALNTCAILSFSEFVTIVANFNLLITKAEGSELRKAFELLKATFDDYAGIDGAPETLTRNEIVELLNKEFPNASSRTLRSVFPKLDADGDSLVTFEEFVVVVADFRLMCS